MNEIYFGQPPDNIKLWCKKWYGKNIGWCVKTSDDYYDDGMGGGHI